MTGRSAATVARNLYEAYATREFERAAEWVSEGAEMLVVPTGDRYRGREGYLQQARAWAAAFPDLKVEIHDASGAGERAVVEYTLRGTHTGALVSPGVFLPPTWAPVELRACDVLQFEDGKVARIASYFDAASMLRQLGLLPHSPLHGADRRAALGLYATPLDTSVEQRNKAIVQRFLEEVVNQKNPGAAAVICAPDLAWHGGAIGETRDLPSFQSALASVFASFPDLHLEIHDLTAEADRVAVRVTLRGTQLGSFQGVEPTGKRIVSTASATTGSWRSGGSTTCSA
jgi:steroid delta-isomerase-like uncharacterized protein